MSSFRYSPVATRALTSRYNQGALSAIAWLTAGANAIESKSETTWSTFRPVQPS